MRHLVDLCIRRPVFATVLILVLCVLGAAGYSRLGVDFFPNIEFPVVTVTTVLPGASPREVETEVSDPIEEALSTIGGVDEIRSTSAEGLSLVVVSFRLEVPMDTAAQDVRDKLNLALPNLPDDIEPPVVQRLDPGAAPVLYLSLRSERPTVEVTELADTVVRRRLEGAPGVGSVTVIGGQKREISAQLDPVRMRARGVSAPEVAAALGRQNVQIPGGVLDTGPKSITLRVQGKVQSVEELGDIVVRAQDGAVVRVRDVADILDGPAEAESMANRDGVPAVLLAIRKQSGTNTVAVVDELRDRLPDLQRSLPAGYELEVVRDLSLTVRTAAKNVTNHLIEGSLLAALVVMLFLGNLRATLVSALAIPTSIIATFAVMWWMDFTLNTMTLLALALAVGIVIDDAIVVLENIFRFITEKGYSSDKAASLGTAEISLAVLATTLSLIAVFAPVGFVGGIPGRFLVNFGFTMSAAIAVSLLVSFTLTPSLTARVFRYGGTEPGRLSHIADRFYGPIERLYMRVLRTVMKRRWIVGLLMLASLATIPITGKMVPKSFLPLNDEAEFEVNVRAPEGTSLESTELIIERIARQIRQIPGVEYTLVTVGDTDQRSANVGKAYVRLLDPKDRPESQQQIQERVREEVVAKLPKTLRVNVADVPRIAGTGQSSQSIQYVISGPDLDQLAVYSAELLDVLRAHPGATDVDSSLVLGKPELVAHIDRGRAAELGLSVADVATALRILVGGQKVSTFDEGGEQYDVRLRAGPQWRTDAASLALLTLTSPVAGPVPLSDVVTLVPDTGPAVISRLNRARQVTLAASPRPGFGESDVLDSLDQAVKKLDMPSAYKSGPAGRSKELARTAKGFVFALGLSLVFMYLILAAQFESWLHPITILASLPLTLPFALVSLLIFGQTLNLYSALGILVLFGVVKKNSILQVDHANHLRSEGLPRDEAILQSNKDRLRPILMTTVAFVAGMIPLITSEGIGAGFSKATSGLVIGGQTLSLGLTLLATPVLYSWFDDISAWVGRLTQRRATVVAEEIT